MERVNRVSDVETADSSRKSLYKVGFWSALVASFGAVGYSVVQIMQILKLLSYPLDAIIIYGFSLCIATPFILAMLALH